jgi:RNA polymerase sigma factor (sigma-70 family)
MEPSTIAHAARPTTSDFGNEELARELSDLQEYVRHEGTLLARAPLSRLLFRHQPLLKDLASKVVRNNVGLEFDDMLQEARIGAIDCYPRYQADRGCRLTTFVHLNVSRHLTCAKEQRHMIAVPERQMLLRELILGKFDAFEGKQRQVLAHFGLNSIEEAQAKYVALQPQQSLNYVYISPGDNTTFSTTLADMYEDATCETDDEIITRIDLSDAIASLDPVAARCLGQLVDEGMGQDEIGQANGLSRNQVKNKLFQARQQLRERTASEAISVDLI